MLEDLIECLSRNVAQRLNLSGARSARACANCTQITARRRIGVPGPPFPDNSSDSVRQLTLPPPGEPPGHRRQAKGRLVLRDLGPPTDPIDYRDAADAQCDSPPNKAPMAQSVDGGIAEEIGTEAQARRTRASGQMPDALGLELRPIY
jgi:hypothetical protein